MLVGEISHLGYGIRSFLHHAISYILYSFSFILFISSVSFFHSLSFSFFISFFGFSRLDYSSSFLFGVISADLQKL